MENKNNVYLYGIIAVLMLLLTIFYTSNKKHKHELELAELNIIALNDTITYTRNKFGEEQASKNELIVDIKNLKNVNKDLASEVDKLNKKDKKNLIEITKFQIEIKRLKDSVDKLNNGVTEIKPGVFKIDFSKKDTFREIEGYTTLKTTSKPDSIETFLTTDNTYTDLTVGRRSVKDGIEIFASSSNPSVKVTKIDGALLKPEEMAKYMKKKKFVIAGGIGYGATIKGLQPFAGILIGYKILDF